jgi:hypothetical protein
LAAALACSGRLLAARAASRDVHTQVARLLPCVSGVPYLRARVVSDYRRA